MDEGKICLRRGGWEEGGGERERKGKEKQMYKNKYLQMVYKISEYSR